jgi:hypothetical protein
MGVDFGLTWWVGTLIATGLGAIVGILIQYWVPIVQWAGYLVARVFHRPIDLQGVLVFEPPERVDGFGRRAYDSVRNRFASVQLGTVEVDKAILADGIYGFTLQNFSGSAIHIAFTPHGLTSARVDEFLAKVGDVVMALRQDKLLGNFVQGSVTIQLPHRPERISVRPGSGLRISDYSIGLKRKGVVCDIQLRPSGRFELASENYAHLLDVVRRVR